MLTRPAGGPAVRALVGLVVTTLVVSGSFGVWASQFSHSPSQSSLSTPENSGAVFSAVHTPRGAPNSHPSLFVHTSAENTAGVVTNTIFPGFNTSLPASFASSIAAWVVGTPTYVSPTNTLWFPQRSVAVPGYPWPTVSPAAVFNLTAGRFDGLVTNLSNASALAYDPGDGDVYAAIPSGNIVEIVNPNSGDIVAPAIGVGKSPAALALDANSNQLFVANSGSNNVTIINTMLNAVSFPNIPVGTGPTSLAYDPTDRLVFVANSGSKNITVINASDPSQVPGSIPLIFGSATFVTYSIRTDTIEASVPSSIYATIIGFASNKPTPITQDAPVGAGVVSGVASANGTEFLLGNASGGDVVVLNSSSGAPVGSTIHVQSDATELAIDPATGSVYSWGSIDRVLDEINATYDTEKSVTTTAFPSIVSLAVLNDANRTYGVTSNGSFLYSINSNSLSLASPVANLPHAPVSLAIEQSAARAFIGTTDGVQALNLSGSGGSQSVEGLSGNCSQLAIDPVSDLLWLSNGLLGVIAVNLTTLQIAVSTSLTLPIGVTQGIAVDPLNSETFVLTSTSTVSVLDSHTGHSIVTGLEVGRNVTVLVFDPTDDQVYALGDAITMIDGSSLSVDGGPVPIPGPHRVLSAIFDPSREVVYVSIEGSLPGLQSQILSFDGSSVTGVLTAVLSLPVGEDSTALAVMGGPNLSNSGFATIWVANQLSGTISVISTPPEITSIRAVPAQIDLGETTSIDVTVEGGAISTRVVFWSLPPGCQTEDVVELNCTPSETGVFTVNVTATDAIGVSASSSVSLSVVPSLSIGVTFLSKTFPEIDKGIPLIGAAQAHNGTPPYSIDWNFGDDTVASGSSVSHAYQSPGSYVINTQARDATGASVNSSTLVTVVARPSASISAAPGLATDVDRPITLFGNVTGGIGGSGGNWSFGDGNNASGSSVTHAWTSAGSYNVTYRFVDALGVAANCSVNVLVNPPLSATFTSGYFSANNAAFVGASIPFTALVSGGTWPFTVVWTFGDGSNASGQGVTHAYGAPGLYTTSVVLRDAAGVTLRSNLTVSVVTIPTVGGITSLGGGFGTGLFLGLVLGGVLAAVVLFAAGPRRKSPAPAPPPTPYVPP